jgi:holo-[acyl-carrier protein] synthase
VIVGIGIDAVTVSRLKKWAADPAILKRFFDEREILTVQERGKGMVRSLAVRFAAKEAFVKALGTGLAGISLKDIMILNGQGTKPEMKVEGSALKAMKAAGAEKVFVSLTHEGDMAIASVVLEA